MKSSIRRSAPPVVRRVARRAVDARRRRVGTSTKKLARQVTRLRERVEVLEQEVQESRRLNRRVAELADVVQAMLLPRDGRDESDMQQRLREFDMFGVAPQKAPGDGNPSTG